MRLFCVYLEKARVKIKSSSQLGGVRLGSSLSKLSSDLEERLTRSRRDKRHKTAAVDAARATARQPKRTGIFGTEEVAEAGRRYAAGASLHELAKTYRVGKERISEELRAAGVEIRRQRRDITPEMIAAAVQLYADGLAILPIAKRLGVARSTLGKILIREGVTMRDRRGQPVVLHGAV